MDSPITVEANTHPDSTNQGHLAKDPAFSRLAPAHKQRSRCLESMRIAVCTISAVSVRAWRMCLEYAIGCSLSVDCDDSTG